MLRDQWPSGGMRSPGDIVYRNDPVSHTKIMNWKRAESAASAEAALMTQNSSDTP